MRKPQNTRRAPQTNITLDDVSDITRLLSEIVSLRREMKRARRRAANLEAAIHAALSAQESGESDPFWYLRDEIAHGRGDAYDA